MRLATDSHPIMLAEPSFNRWAQQAAVDGALASALLLRLP